MSAIGDLILDERLQARVRAAERKAHKRQLAEEPTARPFAFPEVEGLISPNARKRDAIVRRSLVAADVMAAGVAMAFGVVTVAGASFRPAFVFALLVVVAVGKLLGLYDRDELVFHKATLDEIPQIFQLGAMYGLVIWLLAPVLMDGAFTRSAALSVWLGSFVLTTIFRWGAREASRQIAPCERCMIVGRSGTRMRLAGKLAASHPRTEVVGYLPLEDERRQRTSWTGSDRRRQRLSIGDLAELVRELDVHRVIVIPGEADSDTMVNAVSTAKASGVKVSILPRLFEVVGSSVEFDNIEGVTILGVRRFGLSRSSAAIKRLTDIVGAALGLLLLSPLLAVVAIAIKLDSPGPVFYRQWRVGRAGRPFRMFKFRSMVQEADDLKPLLQEHNVAGGGLFKVVNDPRLTRVGRLIRRASIDELPQLLNVLHGEMSLVGPRPLVPDEDERVDGRFRRRLRLVPGVTGPWQILGPTRVPLNEMVVMDYLYGANWSLWADVKIMIRTLGHVARRRGV
ncbi:MAG: hypothetical protein QOJ29_2633 [Thermoleophilaceae bacterium]|jgi:exopolysaccharide biosynthesis polyprenyl glycosylphosphotransferase|nr:hypothetical protein [Thermoleophilaceae bacterium]